MAGRFTGDREGRAVGNRSVSVLYSDPPRTVAWLMYPFRLRP